MEKYGFTYDPGSIPDALPAVDGRYARHELFRAFPWAVWNSSVLEGYNFTFSEVDTIINGYAVAGYPIDHIEDVRGIASGWRVALEAMDDHRPADESLMRDINEAITRKTSLIPREFRGESDTVYGDGGRVRTLTGTYTAPPPGEIRGLFDEFSEDDVVERAFLRVPFIARLQPFWDGNKRTALMTSSVDLVNHGHPPLVVEKELKSEWHEGLNTLFMDGDATDVLDVLRRSVLHV